jgi:hypothetical protein
MPTKCWSSLRGRVARFTKLGACGALLPAASPGAVVTTEGFVSVQYSPTYTEPEEINLVNAGGKSCVSDPGKPQLRWVDLQIVLCRVDPDLFTFLTGNPLVLDYAGNAVGNRLNDAINLDGAFGMEVWTDLPTEECAGTPEFGYFLTPYIGQGQVGEWTIENDALTLTIQNARTRAGSGWGVGPYDVDPADVANAPGPLIEPIGARDHLDLHTTTIAPPAAACGAVAMPAAA